MQIQVSTLYPNENCSFQDLYTHSIYTHQDNLLPISIMSHNEGIYRVNSMLASCARLYWRTTYQIHVR